MWARYFYLFFTQRPSTVPASPSGVLLSGGGWLGQGGGAGEARPCTASGPGSGHRQRARPWLCLHRLHILPSEGVTSGLNSLKRLPNRFHRMENLNEKEHF